MYLCDDAPARGNVDQSLPIGHLCGLLFGLFLPRQKIHLLFSKPRMESCIISNIKLMFELQQALPGLSKYVHGLLVVVV